MASTSTALALASDVPCCPQQFHDRFKASTKAWKSATLAGYQPGYPSTDLYEMRICPKCGTSMLRQVRIVALQYLRAPRRAVPRMATTRNTARAAQ